MRNWKKGVEGNLEGEGRLLGGRFCKSAVDNSVEFFWVFPPNKQAGRVLLTCQL